MDRLEYCRELAIPPGSSLYYASLFVAPPARQRLVALHAFEAEVERCLIASHDPGVIRLRLQWWHDELQRAAAGEARHPVGRALQDLLQAAWLTPADLGNYLLAREAELGPQSMHTDFTELLGGFTRGAGKLWYLSASVCGVKTTDDLAAAAQLGGLHYLFLALQGLADDLRRGYCRAIPVTELPANDAATTIPAANWTPVLGRQFQRLRDEMLHVIDHTPVTLARPAPHCPILMHMDMALCREILRDDCAILEKRYALTPLRKLWIAWRTSRKIG
jgi:15-cis-phytoene synthase